MGEVVEWIIDDHRRLVLQRSDKATEGIKKTTTENLKEDFGYLFGDCKEAFR
jgi:hypothetical protein